MCVIGRNIIANTHVCTERMYLNPYDYSANQQHIFVPHSRIGQQHARERLRNECMQAARCSRFIQPPAHTYDALLCPLAPHPGPLSHTIMLHTSITYGLYDRPLDISLSGVRAPYSKPHACFPWDMTVHVFTRPHFRIETPLTQSSHLGPRSFG